MRNAFLAIPILVTAVSTSAHAEEIDWSSQLSGLTSVTVTCANANTEKYAARICADMRQRTVEKFEKADIKVADLGDYFTKNETRPANPEGVSTPLAITIQVRGSNSNGVYAINLRNHLSVFYEAAVEQGSQQKGRKGELVLWDGSTTGSGPRKQLAAAIVGASFQKLEEQLDSVIKVWPKD